MAIIGLRLGARAGQAGVGRARLARLPRPCPDLGEGGRNAGERALKGLALILIRRISTGTSGDIGISGDTDSMISQDRPAKLGIALTMTVGADQQACDLGSERVSDPLHQRAAVEFDQALVDTAHAPPGAAGEDEADDLIGAEEGRGAQGASRSIRQGASGASRR